jgi:GT2 family glycosyltransferase
LAANPTVSVIILNYNGEPHLEACLRSLEEMTFPRDRVEVIVADNASTDRSLDLVRSRFPRVHVREHTENLGFSSGNNRAAEGATGRYVAFLNNDTRVDPGWLEPLVETLDRHPDVVCAGSKVLSFDGDRVLFTGGSLNFAGFGFQTGLGDPLDDHGSDEPREILFATGCAMLARRDEFLRTGGFDDDYFAYYEDVDLGWRWWVLGHRVLLVPASVVHHKGDASFRHSASEAKQRLWNRNVLISMMKNYEEPNLRQFLPCALLLTIERALYFLDVEGGEHRQRVLAHFPDLRGDEAERLRAAVGIAHLQGIRDAILQLPETTRKRARIQQERRRSDAELFGRFDLRVDFEDQVNESSFHSMLARLLPWLSVNDLVDSVATDETGQRNLQRLEKAIASYQATMDEFGVELDRKSRAIDRLGNDLLRLTAELERLAPLEAELAAIKAKPWYRAVMATRRLRRLGRSDEA